MKTSSCNRLRTHKITTCYADVDSLDGKAPLTEGLYCIEFPNGIQERHYVYLIKSHCVSMAYINIEYNGVKIKLYLKENDLRICRM